MKELKANEDISLFPPHFIVNVTKKPDCNTNLDTNITVTLHKGEEKSTKSIPFNVFVPKFTAIIKTTKSAAKFVETTRERKPLPSSDEHQCDENKPELRELVKYSQIIGKKLLFI